MDKKQLDNIVESSAMKTFQETQKKLASVYAINESVLAASESAKDLLKIAQGLEPYKEIQKHKTAQNSLSYLSQTLSQNNLISSFDTTSHINSFANLQNLNSSYLNMLESNHSLINAIEIVKSRHKPQFIFPKGFTHMDQISELEVLTNKLKQAFEQYEQISSLESIKTLSRLNDFPFKNIKPVDIDDLTKVTAKNYKEILELDSEVKNELSIASSFEDLSIESQEKLFSLYEVYYLPLLFNCLIALTLLKSSLDESIDLSNKTFILAKNAKFTLSYIGNNIYKPNLSSIIDSIVASGFIMLAIKFFGN